MCVLLIIRLLRLVEGWVPVNRFKLSVSTAIDGPKSVPQLLCCAFLFFKAKFSINFKMKLFECGHNV